METDYTYCVEQQIIKALSLMAVGLHETSCLFSLFPLQPAPYLHFTQ
jgi:hypothetical protein